MPDYSKGIPYSAARLPGESFEDYKERRKILKKVERFVLAGRPGYVEPPQEKKLEPYTEAEAKMLSEMVEN